MNIVIVTLIDFNNNKLSKALQIDGSNPPSKDDFLRIAKQKFNKKFKCIVLTDNDNITDKFALSNLTLYDPEIIISSKKTNTDLKQITLYFSSNEINAKTYESVNQLDSSNSEIKQVFFNIIAKDSYIPSEAIKQLENLKTQFDDLTHLIGMPDLHQGRYPIGSVCISKNTIYPELVGTDIGCGMSLFLLDLDISKYSSNKIQKMSDRLYLESDDPTYTNEIKHNYCVLHNLSKSHFETLGTIGGGNHFCEMQEIHEIHDMDLFNQYKMDQNKYYLTVHSGSRDLGTEILDKYIKKEINIEQYETEHNYAIEWARINREIIADRFVKQLTNTNINTNTELPNKKKLFDLFHNYAEKTEYGYIHRKGAAPAYDKPIIIPGSRGALTYIVQPTNSGETNGWSVAHGAGRKIPRGKLAEGMKNKTQSDREHCLLPSKTEYDISNTVICEKQDLLYEEAPIAYKDIDVVISDLVHFGLVKVIMTLKPVITYKCRDRMHYSCNGKCCDK